MVTNLYRFFLACLGQVNVGPASKLVFKIVNRLTVSDESKLANLLYHQYCGRCLCNRNLHGTSTCSGLLGNDGNRIERVVTENANAFAYRQVHAQAHAWSAG